MKILSPAALLLAGATLMPGAITTSQADFGKLPDGAAVHIYTLTNKNHVQARITNYGGILVSLLAPDRHGQLGDIVLGFDSLNGYLTQPGPFFGALIGRYANRIGHARFSLDGMEYPLEKNNGENTLHGGSQGFDKKLWTPRILPDGGLEVTYRSKDGEEGFPGNLTATVVYHLTDANELRIEYSAVTDKDTVVNLTNHSYFNLKGAGSGDILGHLVTLNASRYTPVDKGLIPTGELRSVAGTPFDFRKPTAIGAHINQTDEQLKFGNGYDHNFVLDRNGSQAATAKAELAARVEEPETGRVMEVWTTQPGVQFYTGNVLATGLTGKQGKVYGPRSAFCLETQHFPDSPNQKQFPSTLLRPGQHFESATIFRLLTH
ncbi:MAG: galactose mutarotase [Acidobacteriia bacterium]|nr:galactose mutarotase [Terriglobia bacterium]